MELFDLLVQVANEPDPNPFLFKVGQKVRVLKKVVDDGQTPHYWAGSICEVIGRSSSFLHKDHWYALKHTNGFTDLFSEEELDNRYAIRS